MIHALKGTVSHISDQSVVLDTGVFAFTIQTASSHHFSKGQVAEIITYLHWNQEQGPSLFGFISELERSTFLLITSCSGIGPKVALAILAGMGAQQFLSAISSGNEKALTQVSGIGQKKAEQIIVQLKHKVAQLINSGVDLGDNQSLEQWSTISQVLQSLNYSRQEITNAISYLAEQPNTQQASFDGLMRHALSFLAKKA